MSNYVIALKNEIFPKGPSRATTRTKMSDQKDEERESTPISNGDMDILVVSNWSSSRSSTRSIPPTSHNIDVVSMITDSKKGKKRHGRFCRFKKTLRDMKSKFKKKFGSVKSNEKMKSFGKRVIQPIQESLENITQLEDSVEGAPYHTSSIGTDEKYRHEATGYNVSTVKPEEPPCKSIYIDKTCQKNRNPPFGTECTEVKSSSACLIELWLDQSEIGNSQNVLDVCELSETEDKFFFKTVHAVPNENCITCDRDSDSDTFNIGRTEEHQPQKHYFLLASDPCETTPVPSVRNAFQCSIGTQTEIKHIQPEIPSNLSPSSNQTTIGWKENRHGVHHGVSNRTDTKCHNHNCDLLPTAAGTERIDSPNETMMKTDTLYTHTNGIYTGNGIHKEVHTGERESNSYNDETFVGERESNSYNDETFAGEKESNSHNDETFAEEKESNSHNDETFAGEKESNSHHDETFAKEGESNSQNSKTFTREGESNSHHDETFAGEGESNSQNSKTFTGEKESNSQNNETFTGVKESNSQNNETLTGGGESNSQNNETFTEGRESNSQNNETFTGEKESNSQNNKTFTGEGESNSQNNETFTGEKESNSQNNETFTGEGESNSQNIETLTGEKESNSQNNETVAGEKECKSQIKVTLAVGMDPLSQNSHNDETFTEGGESNSHNDETFTGEGESNSQNNKTFTGEGESNSQNNETFTGENESNSQNNETVAGEKECKSQIKVTLAVGMYPLSQNDEIHTDETGSDIQNDNTWSEQGYPVDETHLDKRENASQNDEISTGGGTIDNHNNMKYLRIGRKCGSQSSEIHNGVLLTDSQIDETRVSRNMSVRHDKGHSKGNKHDTKNDETYRGGAMTDKLKQLNVEGGIRDKVMCDNGNSVKNLEEEFPNYNNTEIDRIGSCYKADTSKEKGKGENQTDTKEIHDCNKADVQVRGGTAGTLQEETHSGGGTSYSHNDETSAGGKPHDRLKEETHQGNVIPSRLNGVKDVGAGMFDIQVYKVQKAEVVRVGQIARTPASKIICDSKNADILVEEGTYNSQHEIQSSKSIPNSQKDEIHKGVQISDRYSDKMHAGERVRDSLNAEKPADGGPLEISDTKRCIKEGRTGDLNGDMETCDPYTTEGMRGSQASEGNQENVEPIKEGERFSSQQAVFPQDPATVPAGARPKKPDLCNSATRLKSFQSAPRNLLVHREMLVDNGLYYTGNGAVVSCFSCHVTLDFSDRSVKIPISHVLKSPCCRYLELTIGRRCIDQSCINYIQKSSKKLGNLPPDSTSSVSQNRPCDLRPSSHQNRPTADESRFQTSYVSNNELRRQSTVRKPGEHSNTHDKGIQSIERHDVTVSGRQSSDLTDLKAIDGTYSRLQDASRENIPSPVSEQVRFPTDHTVPFTDGSGEDVDGLAVLGTSYKVPFYHKERLVISSHRNGSPKNGHGKTLKEHLIVSLGSDLLSFEMMQEFFDTFSILRGCKVFSNIDLPRPCPTLSSNEGVFVVYEDPRCRGASLYDIGHFIVVRIFDEVTQNQAHATVFDHLSSDDVNSHTIELIKELLYLQSGTTLTVNMFPVQRQLMDKDCGPMALNDVIQIKHRQVEHLRGRFDQSQIRSHLRYCVEQGTLTCLEPIPGCEFDTRDSKIVYHKTI